MDARQKERVWHLSLIPDSEYWFQIDAGFDLVRDFGQLC